MNVNIAPVYSMEILIQIFLFVLFCFLLLIYYKRSNSKKALPLPPGPWKLPLIGNVHQIIGSLPHHSFRDLANKYGPLMHLQLGETSNVIVTSSEIAKEIFTTHDLVFSGRPDILAAKIIMYNNIDIGFSRQIGNCWRNLRKICTSEVLTPKRVRSLRFIREEEVSRLVTDVMSSTGSVINLSDQIFSTISSIVARAAFGGSEDQEAFLSIVDDIVKMLGGFSIADLFPSIEVLQVITGMKAKLERLHKLSDQILENIIRDHKERKARSNYDENHNKENLLDVLLKIQQERSLEFTLTHDHVKAVLLDMFIGGTGTTSTTLEWAMAELIKNPSVMEKAQAEVRRVYKGREFVDESDEIHELKYLTSIVKETLRLHPPGVILLPRESTERCVINGYEIPEKTRILINGWAIGRDPKYWGDEADTFKPERFLDNPIDFRGGGNMNYIPFGGGRRICPGINFAIPSIELPLANLLYHFDWKLPNGITPESFDMSEKFAASVRRSQNLQLIPISYHQA